MASDSAGQSTKSNPSLLKAIGILNVVFGGCFFLCGLGCLNRVTFVAQMQVFPLDANVAKIYDEQLRKGLITQLEQSEKSVADPTLRSALRRERLALKAKRTSIERQINLERLNEDWKWLDGYLWANAITGPVLNLLMLASGLGLLQLRCWARTLGIWVAVLKIVRLVALESFFLLAVMPHVTRATRELLETDVGKAFMIYDKARSTATPPPRDAADYATQIYYAGNIAAVFWVAFGVIYPAIALAVLVRSDVRAACQEAEAAAAESESD